MECQSTQDFLTGFSDSGFQKEELDGYALRGAAFLRHKRNFVKPDGSPVVDEIKSHVLLAESRSIETVCRSTYAAELLGATSTADTMIAMTITLFEMKFGVLGPEKLKLLREQGWGSEPPVTTQLFIDARSVYESLNATNFKPPVEHSLAGHVLWLRELYERGLISNIFWTDTRDMYADGLTKGSVPRIGLEQIMSGKLKIAHQALGLTRTVPRFRDRKLLT